MEDYGCGSEGGEALAGELVDGFVLVEVELHSGQALGLDAQHHHDLRLAEGGFEVADNFYAGTGLGGEFGQQGGRSAEQQARAETRQQQHIRAGDAAVEDVAGDADRHAGEGFGGDLFDAGAQMSEDGAQVEQGLGGMLVHSVAAVEDGQAGLGFELPGRAGAGVADDDRLGSEGAQGQAGVFERLALFNAGRLVRDQRGVRAESLGGQLEAGAGAGGGLVKEQCDAAFGQNAGAGEWVLVFESGSAGEEMAQAFESQVLGSEQRAGVVGKRRGRDGRSG